MSAVIFMPVFLLMMGGDKAAEAPSDTKALASRQVQPISPEGLAHQLGVAHVAGDYSFTESDFLNEGADEILKLGSRVIKVWFMRDLNGSYPFGPRFPEYQTLVELAKTEPFRRLFDKPFTTFILETYALGVPDHYWKGGVSPEQAAEERRQFQELTEHLLTTYTGTGKTFILQHWEGDWAIRDGFDPEQVPSKTAIQGMIDWLNARQDGVEAAREAFFKGSSTGTKKIAVYHAAEVNLILPAIEGKTSVVNDVLPHTRCDLYSYSAYETSIAGERFMEALEYLAEKAPDSPAFGEKNVFLGEFGVPEVEFGEETTVTSVQRTLEQATEWGVPYLIYWQIYDNECRVTPAKEEEECRGFWLITPTRRPSAVHTLFQSLFKADAASRPKSR